MTEVISRYKNPFPSGPKKRAIRIPIAERARKIAILLANVAMLFDASPNSEDLSGA
jgi:hypothetical protein